MRKAPHPVKDTGLCSGDVRSPVCLNLPAARIVGVTIIGVGIAVAVSVALVFLVFHTGKIAVFSFCAALGCTSRTTQHSADGCTSALAPAAKSVIVVFMVCSLS